MFGFDPVLLVLVIGFAIIGFLVSRRLQSVFEEYSKMPLSSGMTGAQVAEKMLRDNNIYDVKIESVPGKLTDHYNPANKTVNLSPEVYSGRSVSAAAVAAHECGHAVQHAVEYPWLQMRSTLVPIVNFSSRALNFVYIAMIFLAFFANLYAEMLLLIIIFQTAITLFSVITLPVEMDASNRALAWLNNANITRGKEHEAATTALNWAGRTYIVAALASITTLLYYVMRYMGSRD
ncbi:MAG: zinc metallopeptidase [Flavobacteriales bacterium]|nr:zinc metallopeptidase [Flavobacteriales bacterium]